MKSMIGGNKTEEIISVLSRIVSFESQLSSDEKIEEIRRLLGV